MNSARMVYAVGFTLLLLYAGLNFFWEMTKTLWTNLSPITAIGFVISVVVAIAKGHIHPSKMEGNLRILLFIFGGSAIAHAATSLLPDLLRVLFLGDIASVITIGFVIAAIWFKGQEIKGWS